MKKDMGRLTETWGDDQFVLKGYSAVYDRSPSKNHKANYALYKLFMLEELYEAGNMEEYRKVLTEEILTEPCDNDYFRVSGSKTVYSRKPMKRLKVSFALAKLFALESSARFAIAYQSEDDQGFSEHEPYIYDEFENTREKCLEVANDMIEKGYKQVTPIIITEEKESYDWEYVNAHLLIKPL